MPRLCQPCSAQPQFPQGVLPNTADTAVAPACYPHLNHAANSRLTQTEGAVGEGIAASCQLSDANLDQASNSEKTAGTGKADLTSLTSMLQARWKGSEASATKQAEPARAGQIRNFRIKTIEAGKKQITVELVS